MLQPNTILKGVLHVKKNNFGDKGVTVVDDEGIKQYEFEKEELVLTAKLSSKVNALVTQYNETKDEKIALELGKLMTEQILFNTEDKSKQFKTKVKNGKDRK